MLGVNWIVIFVIVILFMIMLGILVGIVLGFVKVMGEFGVMIIFVLNILGRM